MKESEFFDKHLKTLQAGKYIYTLDIDSTKCEI